MTPGRLTARNAAMVAIISMVVSFTTSTLSTAFDAGTVGAAAAGTAAYVPLMPCRLADTRLPVGYTRLDAQTLAIATRNRCGTPPMATSLALTLTAVEPASAGFLTAWPGDQARPVVSNLNFASGQVRANGATVRLDATGSFRVYTSAVADVVVDVVGAFVPTSASNSGRYMPVAPARLFDSRSGPALGVATTTTVRLPAGVPTDAVALALNLTMTESAAPGYVTEFPAGAAMPTSSVLNVDRAGQTRAAAGIFPVSAAGMSLFVSAGGHLVVDIVGYFTGPSAAASTSGLFTAVDPSRLLDTRSTSPLGSGVPLYAGGGIELAVAQGASLAMNVTSVDGDAGFVTAFPAGTPRPGTSTVNSVGAGDVAANFAIAQLSNRGLGVFSQSKTHLLVDVEGWFSGPLATATLPPLTNSAPPTGPTYSECTHEGLASFNATRAGVGARALTVNAGAERFACAWALRLATAGSGISHSSSADRDAAAGCATGENVAYSTGSSPATLIDLWYGSPTHLANLENASYVGVGIGYVVRTETSGATTIYGVTDLALC